MAAPHERLPRGVKTLHRPRGGRSFLASIRHQGKEHPLGLYESEWDAALAYNIAAEAIGRGAKPPNDIPLTHRPSPDTVRSIQQKVLGRLELNRPHRTAEGHPPSLADLTTLFEVTVVGFWRDQASRDPGEIHLNSLHSASNRILMAAGILFWDRGLRFQQELMADLLARRLNDLFRRGDVTRAVLEDDHDDAVQMAWWLALPHEVPGHRGFREEVEFRYAELFQGQGQTSESWAEVLGLQPPFTIEKVRRAYRSRSRFVHPDAGGTHEAFIRLNAAYQDALRSLGDTGRRPSE